MTLAKTITINKRDIAVPVTIMDQLVNWIDPVKGAARYQTRVRMAISGGYQSADRTRRANQLGNKREMDADSAILPDLQTLREDSQNALRNSAIAVGAVKTNVTKIVGTGLKVKPQIDFEALKITEDQATTWQRQARREFALAVDTREFDTERQLPFSVMQGLVLLKTMEDGDVFVNLPRIRRPGSPYAVKGQLIEAARVCNRDFKPDTATTIAGVVKDEHGAPKAYQVCNRHPGNYRLYPRKGFQWDELAAFGKATGQPLVLHLFDKQRPGQTRGVPYLAPVLELIKQLGRYTDAEVMAAVVSGMLTVYVTNEMGSPDINPAPTADNPDGDATKQIDTTGIEMGYGTFVGGFPGDKLEVINPARPNTAFDPFVMAVLRQIGVALELPFELLVKHFTASYSAARAALLEAQAYFMRRRHWLATQFCQPIYEAVISEAVATGRLKAPGFFADPLLRRAWLGSSWTGDAFGQLDELKAVTAARERIGLRITTRDDESIAMTGREWEPKIPQMARERTLLVENKLIYDDSPETTTSEQVDSSQGSDKEGADNATD